MPRCGSAENVITSDCDGLCSRSYCQRGSTAPNRVAVMKLRTLGVSMAARSHGLSERSPPPKLMPMARAGASGGFTTTVELDEVGITLASAGRRGTVSYTHLTLPTI